MMKIKLFSVGFKGEQTVSMRPAPLWDFDKLSLLATYAAYVMEHDID